MAPCSYVPSLQNQSKCVKDNNIIVKKKFEHALPTMNLSMIHINYTKSSRQK